MYTYSFPHNQKSVRYWIESWFSEFIAAVRRARASTPAKNLKNYSNFPQKFETRADLWEILQFWPRFSCCVRIAHRFPSKVSFWVILGSSGEFSVFFHRKKLETNFFEWNFIMKSCTMRASASGRLRSRSGSESNSLSARCDTHTHTHTHTHTDAHAHMRHDALPQLEGEGARGRARERARVCEWEIGRAKARD